MTNITLQKQHRTLWHFIPGLALVQLSPGSPCGVVPFPLLRVPGLVPSPSAILLGMVLKATPFTRTSGKAVTVVCCFAKQYLLRLGIILYGFRLTFSQIADVGISGIIIDVLTLSSTFPGLASWGRSVWSGSATPAG